MAKYRIKKKVGDSMLPFKKVCNNTTNKNNTVYKTADTNDVLKAINKSHKKHTKMLKLLAK